MFITIMHAAIMPWLFKGFINGSLKGPLDKYNIIPQLFQKKVGIFMQLEVLARVMTT